MAATSPIRAVIFDMDGVLTDSEPLINAAAIEMFREKGLPVRPEDFLPFVGTGEDRYIGGVAELYQFPLDLPAAKHRTYEIYLSLVPERLKAFAGAVQLVQACRLRGLRVAIASSADLVKIEANLRQIGLPPETWDALVSAEDAVNKKPAPDIFLAAAGRLKVAPEECVVVEDAVNGVEAAKRAGMRCVAVAQTFPPEKLQAADLVKPSVAALSIGDLVDETAPPPLIPPSSQAAIDAAPSDTLQQRARVWGFWATLGLGAIIGLGELGAQIGAALLFGIGAAVSGTKVDWAALANSGLFLAVGTCVSAPVAVGLCWLFAWLRRGLPPKEYLAWRVVGVRQLLAWSAVLLCLAAISDLVSWLLGRPIVPDVMFELYDTAEFLPLLWLALLVAAPIAEEVLFRGFLFQGLARSAVGAIGATVITAALWAILHLQYDAYGIGTIFVAGLVLGYARWKTSSIYLTIILHMLMNLIATLELLVQRHWAGPGG